ncbi:iron-sulfur cluster biosynthesis protein [Lentilactobacillus sp. Marseille-Q4993]|uniref:HesB/YadR/YfhF family protein n=1 Tax=Lentilactobacillus sp. Marseille-Q4993 TaxID=3039492 RepID=UPI0024BC2DB6|nr:iron-sulfur cluster biosynthesis protein [Lentilactobacillus sp. Marseille-Q4993]
MKITVTDSASKWFEDEMGLSEGNGVRFYGKVYGKTPVHDGFSLALTRDDNPRDIYAETVKDGVTYYVGEGDEWFFKGYDLIVNYDPAISEDLTFGYRENGELDKN